MSVISLNDYRPAARFDEEPWTTVWVQQSDAVDGTWTTILTETLDPVDEDPERPAYRDFTAEYDEEDGTWFRVVFIDADGDQEPTVGIDATAVSYRPAIEDVAALLRARTTDSSGNELGTFTSATRPTDDQVDRLIDQALGEVESRVGTIPDTVVAKARSLASLYTAMLIEASYYPEQATGNESAYERFKELYEAGLAGLLSAITDDSAGRIKGIYSIPMRSAGLPDLVP